MNILEIEEKFKTPEGMEELLNDFQKRVFSRLDYIAGLFRGGNLNDSVVLTNMLDELTGLYLDLKTVFMISVTEKRNRELIYFYNKKIEIENRGDKFVIGTTEKEASGSVANYRRIRNIFEAKSVATEQSISTLQSRLRFVGKETELAK